MQATIYLIHANGVISFYCMDQARAELAAMVAAGMYAYIA